VAVKTLGNVTWTVDRSQFDKKQRRLLSSIKDASKPLSAWAELTGAEIARDWDKMTGSKLWGRSAMFRGVEMWKALKPKYVRKDGTRVPPWGGAAARVALKKDGTPRKRQPKVKASKRPSGARWKAGDVVGRDTDNMWKQFTRNPRLHSSKRAISLMTNTKYAFHQNNLRQFNVLTGGDKERLVVQLKRWLDGLTADWNKSHAA